MREERLLDRPFTGYAPFAMELNVCGNCRAPLQLSMEQTLVTCPYCGFQSRVGNDGVEPAAVSTGPRLAETISLRISPKLAIGLLASETVLPAHHVESLSTSRDDQESLEIDLVAGEGPDPSTHRSVVAASFPLTKRSPRGTVTVETRLVVHEDGAVEVFLHEGGTERRARHAGSVRVTG
jgi:hypothetical protein